MCRLPSPTQPQHSSVKKFLSPVAQDVALYGDGVFKEMTELKRDHEGRP